MPPTAPDRAKHSPAGTRADPPSNGFAITPDDNNDLPAVTRAIWVGVAGDIEAVFADETIDGNGLVFANVPVGYFVGRFRRVTAGTTAGSLIGVY